MTPQGRKAEARAILMRAIRGYLRMDSDDRDIDEAIADFERAVAAEALAPRGPSPELAEAEANLRAANCVPEDGGVCQQCKFDKAIAAELDRLRAENTRLKGGK